MAEPADFALRDDGRICEMERGATIDDLYCVPGKAELVKGEVVVVVMSPGGGTDGYAAGAIVVSLRSTLEPS